MSSGLIVGLVAVFAVLAGVVIYNRLITLRNRTLNGFSQIDVQLQRRYELIPNLVETAKAYMAHESDTLTAVTKARNEASEKCSACAKNPGDASLIGSLASADSALTGAMGRFNMVMENYPDLKADAQMRDLGEELASTENRVAYARQAYSDSVMLYNISREKFPAVLVANLCSFKEADLFQVEDPIMKQTVKVSFA
ncbi:LemA family protein [Granulosicoccus sp.]|nr:LemA family protein [Granulosicoccus sp.]MDB4222275.1 LemA family protein [Granulosicoccus sp.]